MITIGHGDGPEVIVFLSVCNLDGTPMVLDPDALPIEIFTGLTAMFGTSSFRCEVTDIQNTYPPPPGFLGFTVELESVGELGRLATLGVAALGVVVDTGTDRGQAVIVSAGAATPQTWWSEQRQPEIRR